MVGRVKRNAIGGWDFDSWSAVEAHLAWWMREATCGLHEVLKRARIWDHGSIWDRGRCLANRLYVPH